MDLAVNQAIPLCCRGGIHKVFFNKCIIISIKMLRIEPRPLYCQQCCLTIKIMVCSSNTVTEKSTIFLHPKNKNVDSTSADIFDSKILEFDFLFLNSNGFFFRNKNSNDAACSSTVI